MKARKKQNLAIALVLVVLILPLYFLSFKMEEKISRQESQSKLIRSPAVQDISVINMKE